MKIHVESKLDKPVYVNLVCSTTPIKINPNSIRPQVLTENRSIDVNMEGECFNTQGYVLQVWDTLVYNQEPKTYALFDKDYALTTKTENLKSHYSCNRYNRFIGFNRYWNIFLDKIHVV